MPTSLIRTPSAVARAQAARALGVAPKNGGSSALLHSEVKVIAWIEVPFSTEHRDLAAGAEGGERARGGRA